MRVVSYTGHMNRITNWPAIISWTLFLSLGSVFIHHPRSSSRVLKFCTMHTKPSAAGFIHSAARNRLLLRQTCCTNKKEIRRTSQR